MKTKLLFLSIIFSFSNLFGQIPSGYYDSANGLTGYTLKSKLKEIITNGHVAHSYNDLYNGYETTDTDHYYENDGTVLDIYSENPTGSDPYEYEHHQNTCGNYSSEGDCYNREHLMPQSWFNSASPMKSDIHHVVPADGKVNGMRGHYPLADVGNADWTSLNGSKRGACSDTGYSGTVFEPIDEFKGDIARIYFYMATRYEDQIGSWENANADGSDPVLDGSSNKVFEDWYLQVLLRWHHQDPVSQREIDRNNAAYDYQGNRNPYIDHPEWVDAIWNQDPDNEAPSIPQNIVVLNTTEDSIDIQWDASTDNVGINSYQIFVNGNFVGSTTELTYPINGLQAATSYTICVKAQDDAGNLSGCSQEVTVTTLTSSYVINENFDDCPNMEFITISEASDKDWLCKDQYGENNSACIQINGYQENTSSKDWLITANPIDFNQYTNEKFSAYFNYKYGDTPLDVVYSTNYDGGNNPSNFTWTPLPNVTMEVPPGGSTEGEFVISNADISSIEGTAYIAFKYFTEGYAPTRWNVDSVKIYAEENSSSVSDVNINYLSIFPNPTPTNEINIIFYEKLGDVHIKVIDLSGKIIRTQTAIDPQKISIKELQRGFYFIEFTTPSQRLTKKIIVE
jgi:endonuclease I